jgi:hypothetical protein
VGAAGLLTREHCSPDLEAFAWAHYRTPPKERYPGDRHALSRFTHPDVRIACLGVFDTVGALGVPGEVFEAWNRHRYAFHDTKLSSIVDHALHALAVDEKRGPFGPSLWAYPDHKNYASVEQVWFPGVHSNIGGGYEDRRLSDLALRWMLDRIDAKGLGLKRYRDGPEIVGSPGGTLYESRTALYAYSHIKPRIRVINQSILNPSPACASPGSPRTPTLSGRCFTGAFSTGGSEVPLPERDGGEYRPINVQAALSTIYAPGLRFPTYVVGRRNKPLNWIKRDADYAELRSLMPEDHWQGMEAARAARPARVRADSDARAAK